MARRKGLLESLFALLNPKPMSEAREATLEEIGPRKTDFTVFAVYAQTITQENISESEKFGSIIEIPSTRKTLPKGCELSCYSEDGAKLMQEYLRKSLKERIERGELKPDALPSWWETV